MEKHNAIIRRMYNTLLHRDPDSDGLQNYANKLERNVPLFKLIQAITSSEEFLKCQLNIIKSNKPTLFELNNYIEDHENDVLEANKQLAQTNELFQQNCNQIQCLQKENQDLRLKVKTLENNKTPLLHTCVPKKDANTQTDHEQINYILPVKQRKKLINKHNEHINVFMCVRNNDYSLQNTFAQLLNLQTIFDVKFNFYIYENDSTDSTPYLIIDFFRNNNIQGAYKIEKLSKKEWTDVKDINRSKDMATYRNTMKNLCTNINSSQYSLILDTDVEFTPQNFQSMIKLLKNNQDIAMVTPYAFAGDTLKYYDTYALDSPINICVLMPEIQDVYSAFGGFVIIRSSVLKECHWDVTENKLCSEHNYFCNMVRNYGKVVIARDIRVHWRNKFA